MSRPSKPKVYEVPDGYILHESVCRYLEMCNEAVSLLIRNGVLNGYKVGRGANGNIYAVEIRSAQILKLQKEYRIARETSVTGAVSVEAFVSKKLKERKDSTTKQNVNLST